MIYDRKYTDIINAKNIFTNKIQKFISLTQEEQNIIDKAYFNLTAINRITGKINSIWSDLEVWGISKVENDDVKVWEEQELFRKPNFTNIRQNIADILTVLSNLSFVEISTFTAAYNLLNDKYVYTNLNNLEKLLYDIDEILNVWVVQKNQNLYIFGSYNATLSEGELYIE